ncbi:TonB-dependent receptor [Parapedobacter sp. ISTM3]|uniref:TonB-dependent receptor n=1 Tax=Parapedobacter sp. ISTM3 TaxID=2800130 RepID=UPI001906693A|nr:TonB-dependent receptor [Parapedobacter sp. ISTM3]MBK1440542.1 TonB-dependent receptor [Parapedobacter sp. ISTM3]
MIKNKLFAKFKGFPLPLTSRIWTLLMICLTSFSVLASSISLNKRVSIRAENKTIKYILKEIKRQTNYSFWYDVELINNTKKVTMHVENGTLEDVLGQLCTQYGLEFKVNENHIVLLPKRHAPRSDKAALADGAPLNRQQELYKGYVRDQSGEPVGGVTIKVEGTSSATTATDENGQFQFSAVPGGTVTFSHLAYHTNSFTLGEATTLNVVLELIDQALEEVVIVGYGAQKKVNLTGSVAAINAEVINDIPSSSLSNALSGRMSGVLITQSVGKPGATSNIKVRADGTWNSAAPLYVIDGVVRDKFAFDGLDASEVENISILKDGASAAIYGSRAANGVILVTTKRGKVGKPVISYTGSFGVSDATLIPHRQSGYDQAILINNSLAIDQIPTTDNRYFTSDELEYFKNNRWDWLDDSWVNPIRNRHSLNVNGGSEHVRFFVGGTYYNETGSFRNLDFDRYNLRGNLEANITENLTASLNLNIENRDDLKPYWRWDSDNDNMADLYKGLLVRSEMIPPYINGRPNGGFVEWHPLEILADHTGYNRKRYGNYEATLALEYKVPQIEGLSVKVMYNRYNRHAFIKQFNRPYPLYNPVMTGGHGHIATDEIESVKIRNDGDFLFERYDRTDNYQFNTMVNYNNRFGKHDVGAVFVYEQAEGMLDWFNGQRNFFISSAVDQFYAGSPDAINSTVNGTGEEFGRLSYVGRLNYGYDGKYLIEASFRYDGSANFAPSQRWGFFPSVSGAWRISEESFFKNNVRFFDEAKLRASVGLLGNDAVGGWQWLQMYNFVSGSTPVTGAQFGNLSSGIVAGVVPNPNITWEKSLNYNVGLDTRFLQNKMSLTVDGFYKKTYDILGARMESLPTTFGAAMPAENYAKINAYGFELEFAYNDQISQDFSYQVRGNFGYATNKLVLKDEPENIRAFRSEIGLNTGRTLGYVATDIIRTQAQLDALPDGYTIFGQKPELGMLNYQDLRGATSDTPDGKIDEHDMDWIVNRTIPPVNYGLLLGAKWRNLAFEVFVQGVAGNDVLINQRSIEARPHVTNFDFWTDHWTAENPNASFPRPGRNTADAPSTFWVRDGSFARLKNLRVSYDLPADWLRKIAVSQLRVFLNGDNLFLLQNNVKYFDPENSSIIAYPLMKSYTVGVNLNF